MERKRPGKPLLIATLGLATLSYATAQGCGDDEPTPSGNLLAPPVDASVDGGRDSGAMDATSGNLLPPPPQDAALDALTPSGNLIAPPGDASLDAQLPPTSGNLLPPPDASSK